MQRALTIISLPPEVKLSREDLDFLLPMLNMNNVSMEEKGQDQEKILEWQGKEGYGSRRGAPEQGSCDHEQDNTDESDHEQGTDNDMRDSQEVIFSLGQGNSVYVEVLPNDLVPNCAQCYSGWGLSGRVSQQSGATHPMY